MRMRDVEREFEAIFSEHFWALSALLGVAAFFGWIVAKVHEKTLNGKRPRSPLHLTLILLTVLVAMTNLVIADNVARAFSLVGALAIVRFRTFVEDTRDTAFVVFAVVVGMAIGTVNIVAAVAGVPIVALIAHYVSRSKDSVRRASFELDVRCVLNFEPKDHLDGVFALHGIEARAVAASTIQKGAVLELRYVLAIPEGVLPSTFVREINGIAGVQQVDCRVVERRD